MTVDSSARHKHDMNRGKTRPLLDPLAIAMMLGFFRAELDPLVRRLGVDHPDIQRITVTFFENLKCQYDRKLRTQALRLRKHWRKADVPRLLQLPGWASPATQRSIARLILAKDKPGRGVVPSPKSFEDAFNDALTLGLLYVDPTTSPRKRRELHKTMPKHPDLVEAAFRGELAKARRKVPDRTLPHRKASEIAEEEVAEAAGISTAVVHQLGQHVRDASRRERERGNVVLDEPAMTAADLKRLLDYPAEAAKAKLRKPPDFR